MELQACWVFPDKSQMPKSLIFYGVLDRFNEEFDEGGKSDGSHNTDSWGQDQQETDHDTYNIHF